MSFVRFLFPKEHLSDVDYSDDDGPSDEDVSTLPSQDDLTYSDESCSDVDVKSKDVVGIFGASQFVRPLHNPITSQRHYRPITNEYQLDADADTESSNQLSNKDDRAANRAPQDVVSKYRRGLPAPATHALSCPVSYVAILSASIIIVLICAFNFASLQSWILRITSPWSLSSSDAHVPSEDELLSSVRGYVAVQYSGTVRGFTNTFQSHVVNFMAASPYTVHLYFQIATGGDWRSQDGSTGSSVIHSLNTTISHVSSYTNIDGQIVSLRQAVKSIIYGPDRDIETIYNETFAVYDTAQNKGDNLRVFFRAVDGQRQSNDARIAYEQTYGISYEWVIRMRYDSVVRSNIWESLFDVRSLSDVLNITDLPLIPPYTRIAWPANNRDVNYVLGDSVYTPRADWSAYQTPMCDGYSGINDQFGVSNPTIANIVAKRAADHELYREVLRRDPGYPFQPESHLRLAISFRNISTEPINQCYNILRTSVRPNDSVLYTTSTCYHHHYGTECCNLLCPHVEQRVKRMSSNPFANDLNDYVRAVNETYFQLWRLQIDLEKYNWFTFHMYRGQKFKVRCWPHEWGDLYDPYEYHPNSFIHYDGKYYQEFNRLQQCKRTN